MTWVDWNQEGPLVRDIQIGLGAALAEADVDIAGKSTSVQGWNEANIKINKLVYRLIQDQNLPILRTWFRYGQYEPFSEFQVNTVKEEPLSETTDSPKVPSVSHRGFPSPDEVKEYFLAMDDFEEILEQDMYEFLEDNYREFAPEEYKELYLANLDILHHLDRIVEAIDEDDPREQIDEYRQKLKRRSVDVRSELIKNPKFNEEVESTFVEGVHIVRDGLVAASAKEGDITREERKALENAREVYHEHIWRWPALHISMDKMRGADVEEFHQKGYDELDKVRDRTPKKIAELEASFDDAGLLPSGEQYRSTQRPLSESITRLEKAATQL
jgi:hypothetical protein